MSDPFEERLRRSVLDAVCIRNDPALAEQMADHAMTANPRWARPKNSQTVGVLASGGAVAAIAVVITLLAGGHGDDQQAPANRPAAPREGCSHTSGPSIPPVTAFPGQPANAPAPPNQPAHSTCSPTGGFSEGADTTPATPTFHT